MVALSHILMFPPTVLAGPMVIVAPDKGVASDSAGGPMTPRLAHTSLVPRIEFVAPDIGQPVSELTEIEVRFSTETPTELEPDAFKVLYGASKFDVTPRLSGLAGVTRDGTSVGEATLRVAKLQLLLSETDSLGREAQRLVVFTVQ